MLRILSLSILLVAALRLSAAEAELFINPKSVEGITEEQVQALREVQLNMVGHLNGLGVESEVIRRGRSIAIQPTNKPAEEVKALISAKLAEDGLDYEVSTENKLAEKPKPDGVAPKP